MGYFIALPTVGERSNFHQIMRLMKYNKPENHLCSNSYSAGILNFNVLWASALNCRKVGATHFVMLHEDIMPADDTWLDVLRDEMDKVGADIISAVVPVKDLSGVTSTALTIDEDNWDFRRLTMTEIFSMPETFTDDKLVVNNGMMLVDITKPWVEKVTMNIPCRMDVKDGVFAPKMLPEDWKFSLDAKNLGARIYATRKVKLRHMGIFAYPNEVAWGSCATDPLSKKEK